ncbi:MAG TPA: type II toxin-antitoxin system VapC family toxin [Vicinamibacterales bacterium]|nr:type II toxin-antitoxin system VapC family toxin [Vicinamibacterales bacterium]
MPDRVIDASAMAALAFDDRAARSVRDAVAGHRLHAPALLEFELAHAAWKRARQFPDRAGDLADALDIVWQLEVRYRPIDRRAVIETALQTGLTAYDASYLWLSRQLGVPLITLDRKLAAHAERF